MIWTNSNQGGTVALFSILCYDSQGLKSLKNKGLEVLNQEKENMGMKKTICKVDYDTESAELLGKVTAGSIGDPAGYEECLFKTPDGKFFLYTNGGEESPYQKEDIKRMSAAKADEWLKDHQ